MELQQLTTTFPFKITFLLFLLMLVKHIIKSKSHDPDSPLPPGPSKLPFIGHLHHLLGLPHHALKRLSMIHGPLMYLRMGEISALIISSPEMAKQALTTHDLMFGDRASNLAMDIVTYGGRDLAFSPYGEYWRQIRKICISVVLSSKRVNAFWSMKEEEASILIGKISLKAGSPINISHDIYTLTTDIIARATYGKTFKNREALIFIMKEQLRLGSGFALHDLFPSLKYLKMFTGIKSKLEKMTQETDKMLEDIIKEHKQHREREEDLVDVLLKVEEGGEITMDNVKAVLSDVFMAGIDTSSTASEWTFSELLRNPRVMKKAQAEVRHVFRGKEKIELADINELNYLRLVIKESLRLHPPSPLLLPRECRERCELGGYVIPRGTKIIVNAWAIGRDPEQWTDPESFVPERFEDEDIDYKGTNFKYIPFGAGRRICPGILFGIANMELALAKLLYHFDWELAGGANPDQLDMTEKLGGTVGRKNNLYATPILYQP